MGISFLKKKRFSPFERRFLYFCYEISATALAGIFCVARGTRDTKIQVIECQFPLCISLLCDFTQTSSIFVKKFTPPPCHGLVALPREICTECFERLVSNILQGDKMLHFFYFVYIFILIPLS
jgi:hypothetical protein